MIEPFVLAIAAIVMTYIGTAIVRKWAMQGNVIDVPNQRSSHSRPTPRGGGLAIDIVVVTGWITYTFLRLQSSSWSLSLTFTVGVVAIGLIGWLDDLYNLSAKFRIVIHLITALLIISFLGPWRNSDILWAALPLGQPWITWTLTLFWVVGLVNAYNFMDGIDGIAALQAIAAALSWTIIAWYANRMEIVVLNLIIAGSVFGFLAHNWPPARIFMGDVGSTVLGYLFASMPLLFNSLSQKEIRVDPLIAMLPLWPFIFDTSFTFICRVVRRENVFSAHRSHLYQQLTLTGWSHKAVSSLYFCLALIGVILSQLWYRKRLWAAPVAIPFLCVALLIFIASQKRRQPRKNI